MRSHEGRIDDNMRGNNIRSNDGRDALVAARTVPFEHTPVFGYSTKWNSAIAGKHKGKKAWMAKPVTLETVSLDELKKSVASTDGSGDHKLFTHPCFAAMMLEQLAVFRANALAQCLWWPPAVGRRL
jgi:hypothetical protein